MKKMEPRFFSMMLVAGCMLGCSPMDVFAAEDSDVQDEIELRISSNQDSYQSGEDIALQIELHNRNDFAVEAASVYVVLPDGLELKSGLLTAESITLEPDSSIEISAIAEVEDTSGVSSTTQTTTTTTTTTTTSSASTSTTTTTAGSVATNDTVCSTMWIVLMLLCAIVVAFAYRFRKKAVKMFTLLLCGVIAGTSISLDVLNNSPLSAKAAEQISVSLSVTVAENVYEIMANAAYEMPDNAKGVVINTSEMEYDESTGTYMLHHQMSSLNGMLTAASKVSKLSYRIYNDQNELICSDMIQPASIWTTEEFGLYLGKNTISVTATYQDSTVSQAEITIQNTSVTNMFGLELDTADNDEDGVSNYLEAYYETDPENKETDGDGISDYDEIAILGTDPTKMDTDENGINDSDEDFDQDGITNSEELKNGYNPTSNDTDEDGLTDLEEFSGYHTDPLLYDTDGDGARDGKEVELGFDPLVPQSEFTITLNTDDNKDGTAVSVDITLKGNQIESLFVAPVSENALLNENVAGYIVPAYEFRVDGTFESADIHFTFDEALLNDAEFEPVIYYFDEETQTLLELETTLEGNVATAHVTHFSKYILLNKKKVEVVWEKEISAATDHVVVALPLDLALVIDGSGSMSWNDESNLRYLACEELIAQTNDNDRIAVIGFDNYATVCAEFTTDKDAAKAAITETYTDGGTAIYSGMIAANAQFAENNRSAVKVMIVLTDGEDNYPYDYAPLLSDITNAGIIVYTIGLGSESSIDVSLLKTIAETTGGQYYHASSAGDLSEKYGNAKDDIDLSKDSDDDGLCDYYEKGNIRLGTGEWISTDPENPDTDGDGVPDGQEIVPVLSADGKTVIKFQMISDPLEPDSDFDDYDDSEDLAPLIEFIEPLILIHGRCDNTVNTFGLETRVKAGDNDHYDSYLTKANLAYSSVSTQEILTIRSTKKLGYYLTNTGSNGTIYKINKNLFAFNYPNQDFNQYNAAKLSDYIGNLKDAAKKRANPDFIASDVFATHDDYENNHARFVLIGHSNGGLCSRYYIENLGGNANVSKLITIDTPHFGSGIATAGKLLDYPMGMSYPLDVELEPGSTLFGGSTQKIVNLLDKNRQNYINQNQSPALTGNQGGVPYYAVGGYDVGHGVWPVGEIYQLPDSLHDTYFSFEFRRNINSKNDFNNSIRNSGYNLDLGDANGDNVVDTMSQFGVKFNFLGYLQDVVTLKRTALVVDTHPGDHPLSHFHGKTLSVIDTLYWVAEFISD